MHPVNRIPSDQIGAPTAVDVAPDGSLLAICNSSGQLFFFELGDETDIAKGIPPKRRGLLRDARVDGIVGFTSKERLVTYQQDKKVHANIITIWDIEFMKVERNIIDKTLPEEGFDSHLLADCGSLEDWDQARPRLSYADDALFALTDHGRLLVRAGYDWTTRIYDISTGRMLYERKTDAIAITSLAGWMEGSLFVMANGVGRVYVSRYVSKIGSRMVFQDENVQAVAIGGKDGWVIAGVYRYSGEPNLVVLIPHGSRYTTRWRLPANQGSFRGVGFVGTSPRAYSIGDNVCIFWDLERGKEIGRYYVLGGDAPCLCSAVGSPSGRFGILASSYEGVLFFDLDAEP